MIVLFDIDGVIRDVGGSYRRALADTVEQFTQGQFRPSPEVIDALKGEGCWNNDWEAAQELIYRYFEANGQSRAVTSIDYTHIVDFFQSMYRGEQRQSDGTIKWTGYICQEQLLVEKGYFDRLTAANIGWGFFSGATKGSATFILQERVGLENPLLIAMDDAPGKPDPTGMFLALKQLGLPSDRPVIYVGDTAADMYTIANARKADPDRTWIAVGVLPPHVQDDADRQLHYEQTLQHAGAKIVLDNVQKLSPELINQLQ